MSAFLAQDVNLPGAPYLIYCFRTPLGLLGYLTDFPYTLSASNFYFNFKWLESQRA
jgi:hypothetical protein